MLVAVRAAAREGHAVMRWLARWPRALARVAQAPERALQRERGREDEVTKLKTLRLRAWMLVAPREPVVVL